MKNEKETYISNYIIKNIITRVKVDFLSYRANKSLFINPIRPEISDLRQACGEGQYCPLGFVLF